MSGSIVALLLLVRIGWCETKITQHGITWAFNSDYTVGQYANGDYWLVGPVTIVGIDPPSTEAAGRTMNGSMVNPSPTLGTTQGYDTSIPYSTYLSSLNVALDVSPSNPIVIPNGSSLVSTISFVTPVGNDYLRSAEVLTVLDTAPPDGSFRPPYSGTYKTILFNSSDMDYSLLQSLPAVPDTPLLSEVERMFERVWLDHVPNFMGRLFHPSENMPDYGADMAEEVSIGALMLNLDFTNEEKETLLVRYVQLGIDLWGIATNGGKENWVANGGHASGRKFPILFAGLILGDPEMSNVGFETEISFGEDEQTYLGQPTAGYPEGKPLWGQDCGQASYYYDLCVNNSYTSGAKDCRDPEGLVDGCGDGYRECCTSHTWVGFCLATRMLGAVDLWNHPALFGYVDRWMTEVNNPDYTDHFIRNMWDSYGLFYRFYTGVEAWGLYR